MRGGKDRNLPLAREVEVALTSFQEVLVYAGNVFRITNMDVVTQPEKQYVLRLG
jgi:hypothetical protein